MLPIWVLLAYYKGFLSNRRPISYLLLFLCESPEFFILLETRRHIYPLEGLNLWKLLKALIFRVFEMGKWNRRYYPRSNRRGRYQDYDWSPPRETYRDPELGVWQDNVPMWEKKFCFLSGVPWEKVLSASKFMHCQSNIVEWDDTAGKEAFHKAKESYHSKLYGGQCEIHTPNPDAYIGKIDWNPYIDPELINDLERTFFVPDDNNSFKTFNSFGTFKDHIERLDKSDELWDGDHAQSSEALKNKAVGSNQWDQSVDTAEEPTNNNPWDSATRKLYKDNPWEGSHAQTSQVSKDKATVWNQWDADKPANVDNSWDHHGKWDSAITKDNNNHWQCGHSQTSQMLKNKSAGWDQCDNHVNATEKRSNYGRSWGNHDRYGTDSNNYGSRNWRQQSYLNNGNNNQHETGVNRSSYRNGGGSNDRSNNWGRNQFGGQYGGQRRGFVEERGLKREGPGQNMPGYKGPKLRYTDESSRCWKNGGDGKGSVSRLNNYLN